MNDRSTKFWARVQIGTPEECWPWLGPKTRDGYGHGPRGYSSAHRFAYEDRVGPVPGGMQLDHRCHDSACVGGDLCAHRACVNPAHLNPTTPRQNVLRSDTPAARNAAKVECIHGHPFSPENTYLTRNGKRHCRTCVNAASRRYYSRKAAANANANA